MSGVVLIGLIALSLLGCSREGIERAIYENRLNDCRSKATASERTDCLEALVVPSASSR